MLTLFKSKKFQEEYETYKQAISSIDNPTVQKDLTETLSKLVAEIKALDQQHFDMATSKQLPSVAGDHRTKILEHRRKLDRHLSDWKAAQG